MVLCLDRGGCKLPRPLSMGYTRCPSISSVSEFDNPKDNIPTSVNGYVTKQEMRVLNAGVSTQSPRRKPRPHSTSYCYEPDISRTLCCGTACPPVCDVCLQKMVACPFCDARFTSQTERSVAARILKKTRRRRRRPFPRKPIDRASSFSSVTDSSMSLNIITVTLSMDNTSFLGISIVGQTHKQGDGGIYVGTIMPGGAVAQDGRIEPGDMILQVNDVSFENMPNDDAVKVLREVVNRPGPIKLVVAKCWNPNPRSYFTLPKNDPVRPIDPGSWVEATRMMSGRGGPMSPSVTSMTSDGSTLSSSIPDSERGLLPYGQLCLGATGEEKFPPNCDIISVIRAMQHPASGLDIKDRMWLKITIPNAFLGHNLVGWLFDHIDGFTDRREARKYASKMLKDGYIKHTTGKLHFSEQCYYIFNQDLLIPHMNNLSLRDPTEADEEKDQLCPLPQYSNSWIPPQYTGYQPRTAGYSMGELEMFGPNQNSGHSSPGSSNSSSRSSKTRLDDYHHMTGGTPLIGSLPSESLASFRHHNSNDLYVDVV